MVYGIFSEIDNMRKEQQRINERIEIYKELIDVKADIKMLKRGKA